MFDFVQKNTIVIKIILGLVVVGFVGVGVENYSSASDDPYLAKVDGHKLYKRDIDRALEGRPADAMTRQSVIEGLISQQLLLADARKQGLTVTDAALRATIAGIPAFQENGKFSPQNYQNYLQAQDMTAAAFEARVRDDMILQMQLAAYNDSAFVTPGQASRLYAIVAEQRTFSTVSFAPSQFIAQVKIDDAAIKKYYDTNLARFKTPETVKLQYLMLSQAELAKNIHISDAEAQTYFDQHKAELAQPEIRASHILLTVPQNASAQEKSKIKAEAESLDQELKAKPDSFATVARARSQDPGSAGQGGDLGFFGHGVMDKTFEDAAFKLEKGQISPVIETKYGFHIIKLTDKKVPDFATLKDEIETRLARQKATAEFRSMSTTLGDLTYQNPNSLAQAAAQLKITPQTTDWISRESKGQAWFDSPKVLATAFSNDVLNNHNNSEPIEVAPGQIVVLRVAEHQAATQQALSTVADTIRQELTQQQASELAQKQGARELSALQAGKSTVKLAWSNAITASREHARGCP